VREQLKVIGRDTFFITAIPGSIHILELCLKFIPGDINIAIVANGLTTWEVNWLEQNLKFDHLIKINGMYSHGDVINMLVKWVESPFGILDYDCFVFNSNLLYEALKIEKHQQLNAFFSHIDKVNKIEVPSTFFMFINSPLYRKLMQEYHVDCKHKTYLELSKNVRDKIKPIGINRRQLLELYKNYFDTLQLLIVLGIADGYEVNFIERFPAVFNPSKEIFHVGGISDPNSYKHLWGVRGSYLWRLALNNHIDKELISYYESQYGRVTPDDILDSFPNSRIKIGKDFFEFAHKLVNHTTEISFTEYDN